MAQEVIDAMCTPMHQILPVRDPYPSSPTILSVNQTSNTPPGSLFLGSISATVDLDLLKSHHITHVVQVLDPPWVSVSEDDGFRCLRIEIDDKPMADLKPHLEGACQYIASALSCGGNVLVHCQQGISRSPAIVIAYLIRNLGMTYDQAYALVKHCRPCIRPNRGFVAALRTWESSLTPSSQPQCANPYAPLGDGSAALDGDWTSPSPRP